MKKTFLIILSALAAFSLFSCAGNEPEHGSGMTTQIIYVTTAEETTAEDTTKAAETGDETTIVITPKTDVTTAEETTTEAETTTKAETTTEAQTTKTQSESPVVVDGEYEYFSDISKYLKYLDPTTEDDPTLYIIANKQHYLSEDYVPENLKNCGSGVKNCMLTEYTNGAYQALMTEMKALGISTKCQSGYRSYAEQRGIYNNYINKETSKHPKESAEQIQARVDEYSARPGSSEHQTGYAIDFKPIEDYFDTTDAFKYMKDNAYKFGFILRYGKGQTEITGYQYEPWHWRFVGRTAAKYIYEHGITFEEYLTEFGLMPEEAYPND